MENQQITAPEQMLSENDLPTNNTAAAASPTRRKFLGQIAAALAGGAVLGKAAIASAQDAKLTGGVETAPLNGGSDPRVAKSYLLRLKAAIKQALIPVPQHTTNGDETRYADRSGTYSKGILQNGIGLVNPSAFLSFRHAINTGTFAAYESIPMGGTRTLNGPLGGNAFSLEGCDGVLFGNASSPANQISRVVVPPAPALSSASYGTELVELYWASLLRDVPFIDYASNPIAAQAAAELTTMPTYAGPRNGAGNVTPDLLFRGPYPGETAGPYMSQLHVIPTYLGSQPISQQIATYLPNVDYMNDATTFQQVQNGIDTGLSNQLDPQFRYLRNGRDLGAYTHVDVLYQAYFIAFLVLNTIGAPANPGNPYLASVKQNGFGTFGGPDVSAAITTAARLALNTVWYQKWAIHLRHRPESGGAIARQILKGFGNTLQGHVNNNVLNSQAVQASFNRYGDYFLSQAFPEGSPAHPAYPTGHGTVAGACITVLKFFFDGNFVIPDPVVPSNDGLSLLPYTGGGQLTVNGELNKLANNISFGHGIHAGIHWRSDTSSSVQLGEAVAIGMLQDRAQCYAEKFTVRLTKIDGTIATISNQ